LVTIHLTVTGQGDFSGEGLEGQRMISKGAAFAYSSPVGEWNMTYAESDKRLGEAILFICQKSADDEHFGAVKLNKILFYSDFFAYARWAETITGADYWHLDEGPAPRRLVQVREKLVKANALAIQQVERPLGLIQHRPIQLRRPDRSLFNDNQLVLIEEVIAENRNLTATQIANKSHLEWGWRLTKDKEKIELNTIFLSPEPLSDVEQKRAMAMLEASAA